VDIAVVGAGRVGTALAVLLQRAGHTITAVSGRAATRTRAATHLAAVPVRSEVDAAGGADLVILGVPDDEISPAVIRLAQEAAFRPGAWVAHLSGAAGLDVLAPATAAGARRLAFHPLQTIPDVEGALERIPGSLMAVTADDDEGFGLGDRLAAEVGARPFHLPDDRRALYHAAAVFASNYVIASAGIAEELFHRAGVPDPLAALLPLARASLDNVARLGPADALTGPAVRGDAGTIDRNLAALREAAPHAVPGYIEFCRIALELGTRSGRTPDDRRRAVEEVLARWT
jgi:predicted short-subunit dehydrogenase-like oxidoreductase (DUF2520 family)